MPEKNGHKNLCGDLEDLLNEALAFEFHDFKNKKYATPKIELANILERLKNNVINGRYDNEEYKPTMEEILKD